MVRQYGSWILVAALSYPTEFEVSLGHYVKTLSDARLQKSFFWTHALKQSMRFSGTQVNILMSECPGQRLLVSKHPHAWFASKPNSGAQSPEWLGLGENLLMPILSSIPAALGSPLVLWTHSHLWLTW